MGTYNLTTHFEAEVDHRLKEQDGLLDQSDMQAHIKSALWQYNRDKPNYRTDDVTGDGGFDYAVGSLTDWSVGFSQLIDVEYPYSSTSAIPNMLKRDRWVLWTSGDTEYLRFLYATPSATETIRVHYTVPRTFDVSNDVVIFDVDFYALCDLCASHCLDDIASRYVATGDSTIGADSVDHRSKMREALELAKKYKTRYDDHMGKANGVAPAMVTVDLNDEMQNHVDYLTHPSRWR